MDSKKGRERDKKKTNKGKGTNNNTENEKQYPELAKLNGFLKAYSEFLAVTRS